MDQHRFDTLARSLSGLPSRRHLLRGLAGAGVGLGAARLPAVTAAKGKRKDRDTGNGKPKRRNGLCKKDGSPCRRPGKDCQKRFCLDAPFTVEASWTAGDAPYTYLFVPPRDGTTGPSPYIDYSCTQENYACEEAYPFACVKEPGTDGTAETTTIYELVPGSYEYWIELFDNPAAGVTVTLRNRNGRVVRRWTSLTKTSTAQQGWHVFDFDGDGRVTSIDALATPEPLPEAAHDPQTEVCPAG